MSKALRVLVVLVGVVLLTVGAGVAAYVGPDDQVQLARHQVGPPEAPLIVSRPGLFGFRGVTLAVTAQSPGGIFVGAAPERDVARFADGVLHFEIDKLSPSGRLTGKPVMGRRGPDATQKRFLERRVARPGYAADQRAVDRPGDRDRGTGHGAGQDQGQRGRHRVRKGRTLPGEPCCRTRRAGAAGGGRCSPAVTAAAERVTR